MGRAKKKLTIQDALERVRSHTARMAINDALVAYLRLRYLSRDSLEARTKIAMPDGSAVPEEEIELFISELVEDNAGLKDELESMLGEGVDSGA